MCHGAPGRFLLTCRLLSVVETNVSEAKSWVNSEIWTMWTFSATGTRRKRHLGGRQRPTGDNWWGSGSELGEVSLPFHRHIADPSVEEEGC